MDTYDDTGVFAGSQPCNNAIKGLISSEETGTLPNYVLFLNFGDGNLHRRTFIPHRADKLRDGELTTWAKQTQEGTLHMMFLEKGVGTKASISLPANQTIGQEEFKMWTQK